MSLPSVIDLPSLHSVSLHFLSAMSPHWNLNRERYFKKNFLLSFREWIDIIILLIKQICRDECEMLEEAVCRQEYAIAKKTPVLMDLVALCEQLPSAGSKESENCLRLGVPNVVQVVRGKRYCRPLFLS
jgi:hypothetical protein